MSYRDNLRRAVLGEYEVVLIQADGNEFIAAQSLQIIEADTAPSLSASLEVPDAIRPGRQYSLSIRYTNISGTDITPPLLEVRSNVPLALTADGPGATRVQLLAPGNPPDRTILGAGMSGFVNLYFTAPDDLDPAFELAVLTDESAAVNWQDHKAKMRPSAIDEAEWELIWSDLVAELGSTWGDYRDRLVQESERYLARGALALDARPLLELVIDTIRGLPTAAISGTLTRADNGWPLSGVTLTARSSDDTILRQLETGGESSGWFSFKDLLPGRYSLYAAGYVFDPAILVTVTDDTDINGLVLAAQPIPADEPSVEVGTPQSAPALASDSAGSLFIVWQEGAYLAWAMRDPAENWLSGWMGEGIAGSAPGLWYTPDLEGRPALVALWVQDTEEASTLAMAVARIASDGLEWGEPQDLTFDAYADMAPALTLDGEQVVALWLQRDLAREDDTDLYWLRQPAADASLPWVGGDLGAGLGDTSPRWIGMNSLSGCGGISYEPHARVPNWVPVIGGRWGFKVGGQACITPKSECGGGTISGSAQAEAEAESGLGVLAASGSLDISGDYGIDPKSCRYVWGDVKLSIPHFQGTADILSPNIPVVILGMPLGQMRIGGTLTGFAAGSLTWRGSFPSWPEEGGLDLNIAAGPKVEFESIGKVLEAEAMATLGGQFDYSLPPGDWANDWCVSVSGTVKTNLWRFSVKGDWEKQWGCNEAAAQALRLAPEEITESDPARFFMHRAFVSIIEESATDIEESLLYEKNDFVGTGSIYEGAPVLDDISHDLYPDGPPAIVQGPEGEILAVWVRHHAPSALGGEVWGAWYDGVGGWLSAPLTPERDFHRSPALAIDSSGTPMVLWARASNAGLDFDLSSVEALLDASRQSDIWFSRYDDQSGDWTAPEVVANPAGSDELPTLTAGTNGTLIAAWLHTPEDAADTGAHTLLSTVWNGSAWSAPVEVASGVLLDEPQTIDIDGRPALAWSQDSDGELETLNDRQLMLSFWDGASWSAPEHPEIAPAELSTNQALRIQASSAGTWVLGDPPESCCEQPGEEEPGTPEDDAPWQHEDDAASTLVRSRDPNEKVGPSGFGTNRGVEAGSRLDYLVYFENMATAEVPAQEVFITDCLADTYDWDSFELDAIAFGNVIRANDSTEALYETRLVVPDYRSDVATSWWVDFSTELDHETGCVTATFRTLDPETGELPTDVYAGFLPPEDGSGRGQGHIAFSVATRPDLTDGTLVSNGASIVFDTNAPILTNTWTNPIGIRPDAFNLHVSVTGQGQVTSTDGSLDCDADCTLAYATDSRVVLKAIPNASMSFSGWEGACFGDDPNCVLTMDAAKSVTATFEASVDPPVDRDTAWRITEIYIATMGYAPDDDGLQYWIDQIETSTAWTPETVAQSFFDQPLVEALYPTGQDYGGFIGSLYINIFGRSADAEGYSYWLDALNAGSVSRDQMIIALINGGWANTSPEAQLDMQRFGYRVEVGRAFADYQAEHGIHYNQLSETDQARLRDAGREVLEGITADPATRDAAIANIPTLIDQL